MKNTKLILIALAIMIAGNVTHAQQDSKQKTATPHGGVVKSAGNNFIEAVLSDNTLAIYLLDANQKTIGNAKVSAIGSTITIDNVYVDQPMKAIGDDHYMITLYKKNFSNMVISLKMNDALLSATFTKSELDAKAKEAADALVYSCPMHPDVKSDKPGKCSKCGMNLVKADK